MFSRFIKCLPWLVLCFCTQVSAQFTVENIIDEIVESNGGEFCSGLSPIPIDSCKSIISAAGRSMVGGSLEDIKEQLKEELAGPEFLNSAITKAFSGNVPLGLEFKALDTDGGDTVLGLAYAIDYEFARRQVSESRNWNRHYSIALEATGTVTENSDENPRNLLETKLEVYGTFSTKLPQQSQEFGERLQKYAVKIAQCEEDQGSQECKEANTSGFNLLDSTAQFIKSFQYYEFGLDLGYESDQSFGAQQSTVGAFVFGQYESWGSGKLLGLLNISPAVRLGINSVNPNKDTPRAMAGDNSSFYRIAAEVSLWIPLGARIPLAFTYNYQHYLEIDASSIVKDANLDSFNLSTYSLSGTNGLFVSYSSGRLPLDLQSDNVVEIGWKTYF